jgi:hypothetical protein
VAPKPRRSGALNLPIKQVTAHTPPPEPSDPKGQCMPTKIDLARLRGLLEGHAQLVEVLPPDAYAEEHLPGAINIPIKTLDATTTARLDRARPVIVYCSDGL